MKIQMQLGRETVLAFRKFKHIQYNDPDIDASYGYVLDAAYNIVKNDLEEIDWITVSKKSIDGITINGNPEIGKVQTTMILDDILVEKLKELQMFLSKSKDNTRIYLPYVVKLIVLSAILKLDSNLPKKSNELLDN